MRDLLARVPELQPLYNEHIEDNGELLPHVFMGDVTRFVVSLHAKSLGKRFDSIESRRTLMKILDFFEENMRGADDVQELISVSFLENLDQSAENYASLKSYFGGSLLDELSKYEE
jgi:hypothetical protein